MLSQRPRPFKVSSRKAPFAVVMVMGGDSDLVKQLKPDLDEMSAGVSDQVSVLVLVDLPGDSGGVVAEVTPRGIRPLVQLPEFSTGDPLVLAEFFGRALVSYSPKTRFALGFWGHGNGVFADEDPDEMVLPAALLKMPLPERPPRRRRREGGPGALSMLPDSHGGDVLTNREARSALGAAFARAGRTERVDMIFSDTCLNGSVEVFTELREFTKTVVASSLLVPGDGWNYTYWLEKLEERRPADAKAWAEQAVEAFETAYPQVGGWDRAQLAAYSTEDGDIVKAFGKVVKALSEMKGTRRRLLRQAANMVQSVQYRENLDLEQLVDRLEYLSERDSPLRKACQACLRVLRETLVAISASPEGGDELSGLTIWCPIRGDEMKVSRTYPKLEFAKKTKWWKLLKDIEADQPSAAPVSI
jgi:hypothetical protein